MVSAQAGASEMNRESLILIWGLAFEHMDERLAEIEPRVVRREWADDVRYSLRPLQFERFGRKGRELDSRELMQRGGAAFEYGFDADDRLLMASDPYPGGPYTSLFLYEGSVVTVITYHGPTEIPWAVEQAEYEDGRQTAYGRMALGSWLTRPGFGDNRDPEALASRHGLEILLEMLVWEDDAIIRIDGKAGTASGRLDRYVVRPKINIHTGPE